MGPLLKRLNGQTYPIHRTMIVDNGSSDGSVTVARGAGAEVIPLDRNYGFAYAVNRGLEAVSTEWALILNNDVDPDPDWLERLIAGARQLGASFASGKLLQSANPDHLDGAWDLICRGGTAWRAGHGRPDGPEWSRIRTVRFVSLTAALFRTRVFAQAGPLDERFESYLEDVDLGLRFAAAGLIGAYVPGAVARHAGSGTRGAWHKDTVRQISRNQVFLFFKHIRREGVWPALVAQVLWGLLATRAGAGGAFLAGKREGWLGRRWFNGGTSRDGRIAGILRESEDELLALQRRTGFDSYWRWYFMLTRGIAR